MISVDKISTEVPMRRFSCLTCQKFFDSPEGQKDHFRNDGHQKNLKRKIAGLPPIDFDAPSKLSTGFTKLEDIDGLQSHRRMGTDDTEDSFVNYESTRKVTSFNFSKREEETDSDTSESSVLEGRLLHPEECFFCPQFEVSFEANVNHMCHEHGLYIPAANQVLNLLSLFEYLAGKISASCCLYCSRSFKNLEALRKHMSDKGHMKIRFDMEGSRELAIFYKVPSIRHGASRDRPVFPSSSGDDTGMALISKRHNKRVLDDHESDLKPNLKSGYSQQQVSQITHNRLSFVSFPENSQRDYHVHCQMQEDEERNKSLLKSGTKNNKLQPHFRHQLRQ